MSQYNYRQLVWVPVPGLSREKVIEDITSDCVSYHIPPSPDHVWVAKIEHKGTMLYCYAVQLGPYTQADKEGNVWYVKKIPESVGPDVFDCSRELLEMCHPTNVRWRDRVYEALKNG